MRSSLIAYLRKRGRFLQDWIGYAVPEHTKDTKCQICGRGAQASTLSLNLPDTDVRQIVICCRCGIIEDAPAETKLGMRIAPDGRVLLIGTLRRCWAGAVLVWGQAVSDGVSYNWPTDKKGHAAPFVRLPAVPRLGPLNISVILIHHTNLYFFNRHETAFWSDSKAVSRLRNKPGFGLDDIEGLYKLNSGALPVS